MGDGGEGGAEKGGDDRGDRSVIEGGCALLLHCTEHP